MRHDYDAITVRWMLVATFLVAPLVSARADAFPDDLAAIRRQMEQLSRENAEMMRTIETLEREVQTARDEAMAALELAEAGAADRSAALADVSAAGAPPPREDAAIFSRQVGRANLRLIDISIDTLFAAGTSTGTNEEIATLQGGGHDPRQRGFTLQNVELSLLGAVDPYMIGEAHVIYFLDTDGESQFEIEEAFLTSQMLPFGLERHGFEVEAGHFFTEFGRINPRHPHQWDWQDAPIINARLFGEDGMRAPGVRIGWLAPLPWFSELHVGMQNAAGETMVSFLGNDAVFGERPVGGFPSRGREVDGLDDLVYLVRWVNGFDLSDSLSAQWGLSGLFGPNGTGNDGRTRIYGTDLVVKWQSVDSDRGWPHLIWKTEFMYRDYGTDNFAGCLELVPDCQPVFIESTSLRDWGLYSQLLWGFKRGWSAGIRYGYATSDGDDFDRESDSLVSTRKDPLRSTRHRISPLVMFQPSEFSRLRLQYNYDRVTYLDTRNNHTAWAGVEFLFGSHAAHRY